jgi:16S rRNA (guanine527-N7)-methyltransferase
MVQPPNTAITDAASFEAAFPVSRETIERLALYADLMAHWQKSINLISSKTLDEFWHRHIADSAQLLKFMPENTKRWIDLGSGGGPPGLVVAICLGDIPGVQVDLVESNAKKCAFLREVIRQTGINTRIYNQRIEEFVSTQKPVDYDVVSARALAPLPRLLEYAETFIQRGAVGLFLKGQHVDEELTEATKCWMIKAQRHPSLTDSQGSILIVESANRV